ncbi:MAG TPA: AmmeMemoRadiSam system protein B [Candidatus Bipolaricaulota bacterium]|nr:AmmeMemoRadiSam system protein B [Candidatus Bipolaricaulota bacterium]
MKSNVFNIILVAVILLVSLQAGLLLIFISNNREADSIVEYDAMHYSFINDRNFYDQAYEQAAGQVNRPPSRVYAGIVPHHLIVKDKIAAFFLGIEDFDYETIILIGPNHYNAGYARRITSTAAWNTPYGVLLPDQDLIKAIIDNTEVKIEEAPFENEHGITGLVPFIKKSFPDAKIMPIIIKDTVTSLEAELLAKVIVRSVDPEKTLILASIDFSHDKQADQADIADELSNKAILSYDFDKIYSLELDSRPAVYFMLSYLKFMGIDGSERIFHTNSGKLLGKPDEPTTSHQIFYFY